MYAGHPVDPSRYIPVADFHRFLFEHKMAEAQRLLRSLGAKTITVIHIEGWDRSSGMEFGISAPVGPGGAPSGATISGGVRQGNERAVLASMNLTPIRRPSIPDGLVWYPHEPLWQEAAQARLESQLDSFLINVSSIEDYGVNASLKAHIAKVGLGVGGTFVEHRKTVWQLAGNFATGGRFFRLT